MPVRTSYDPKPYAFEIVGVSGVADAINSKYASGWRVIQMAAHPDGRVMILLEQTEHAKTN